jgi:hypothetical protein
MIGIERNAVRLHFDCAQCDNANCHHESTGPLSVTTVTVILSAAEGFLQVHFDCAQCDSWMSAL